MACGARRIFEQEEGIVTNFANDKVLELYKTLKSLDICLGVDENTGEFTVYTKSEPLFCYTAKTKEEIDLYVQNTLLSYAQTFYKVDLEAVAIESTPFSKPALPVRTLTPLSTIRPVFNQGEQCVTV